MVHTVLRCHTCGVRVEINLSETDKRRLRGEGYLTRHCRECRGNTRWEVYESSAPARLLDAGPEEMSRGRILIIDDDENVLLILGKALGREQFDLQMATSAREAITLLARGDFDVVISDILMPGFDGKQLFQFLEEHLPEAKERVVFITADMSNPDTVTFLQEAKRPYLAKPIDIGTLLEMIRPYLPASKGASTQGDG
ncbi:MAG TPA: response regulator [Candidatus Acidoferrales bacterium]|nr:response regulator [Candidatus Acidoferrales bacterium]